MSARSIILSMALFSLLPGAAPVSAGELEDAVTSALQADDPAALQKSVVRLKAADPRSPVLARGLVRLAGMRQDETIYEALFTLNAAIDEHPDDIGLKRARALFIVSAPWQRLALADLEQVIAADDPGAVALQAFVDAAANNDQTDLGEAKLSAALAGKQHRDPDLLRARAEIRYIRSAFDGALQDLAAATAISPPTVSDHLLRYRIHTRQGSDKAALDDINAMRKMLPNDRGLMRIGADVLTRLGRSGEAAVLLKKASR